MPNRYDYIIVGAGSASCVLAHRLSADPSIKVLLLEAGPRDWNPFIHMPAGLSKLVNFKSLNWNYETEPEPALNNRKLYWPRGKVLGGSSSINAICYSRGHRSDYDDWAGLGNPGWDWNAVLPYFKRAEDQSRGPSELHGTGGPLSVSDLSYTNELSDVFVEAAGQAGFPCNNDFNGLARRGAGIYQVTQREGRRCSTAAGYLKPIRSRPNLTVLTSALTLGLTFSDPDRVRGVRYAWKILPILDYDSGNTLHALISVGLTMIKFFIYIGLVFSFTAKASDLQLLEIVPNSPSSDDQIVLVLNNGPLQPGCFRTYRNVDGDIYDYDVTEGLINVDIILSHAICVADFTLEFPLTALEPGNYTLRVNRVTVNDQFPVDESVRMFLDEISFGVGPTIRPVPTLSGTGLLYFTIGLVVLALFASRKNKTIFQQKS